MDNTRTRQAVISLSHTPRSHASVTSPQPFARTLTAAMTVWHPITSDWLAPIPGLHRRDPEHRYWLGQRPFGVSVTGVLAAGKSAYAMARIEATREHWEPRGNTAHRALELLLGMEQGADMAELQQLAQGPWGDWVNPLISHPRWQEVTIRASERATCCPRRGLAGTYDASWVDPSLPPSEARPGAVQGPAAVLADLKSLGENGSTYSTAAQLGGYMALEASWGHWYDYGQTIWARPGQTQFSRLYSRAECLAAWAAAWAYWRSIPPARGIALP
jgi:hypothetical protein